MELTHNIASDGWTTSRDDTTSSRVFRNWDIVTAVPGDDIWMVSQCITYMVYDGIDPCIM